MKIFTIEVIAAIAFSLYNLLKSSISTLMRRVLI